jgi:RimK family alpha-L-glutamate ligase
MKKILILVNRTITNKNSFYDGLKKDLPSDVLINIAHFEDITLDIEGKNITVFVGRENILGYDLVYFRRAGREFLWLAATVAVYLESRGKKYFDSTYREVGPTGAKLTSLLKLALAGLPVVPTFFCYKGNILEMADVIMEKFGLPLVAKDLYSQRGRGVFLIKKRKDFDELVAKSPDSKFLFQKYINKKEEFRVLVLGGKIGSYERKTSTDPNEFRNNVSLGAKEDFMEINQIADDVKNISIKSAKVLKIEVAGVDITVDTEGKVWVLEVNRGPGFTYKSSVSREVANIADFFAREVRKIKISKAWPVKAPVKKKVGICFSKELQGETPLSHIIEKLPVYMRLLELMEEEGWQTYVLTRKTYKGKSVFEGGWRFKGGKFSLVRNVLKTDLVYDRTGGVAFPLKNDHLRVVNKRDFKVLAWDKWATYKVIGEYMPKTFLLENGGELPQILPEIESNIVVLKPFNGLKGIGIFIGGKDAAMKFKFNKKYSRYIVQEFVDTAGGIPGVTPGMHDLRIVIVNGKPVWCHVRVPAKGKLLANAAQGGSLTEVDYENIPVSIKKVVGKVSELFSRKYDNPIYSLDFGIGKNGKPYIFEINDQMGFPKWGMKNRDVFLRGLIVIFKEKLAQK